MIPKLIQAVEIEMFRSHMRDFVHFFKIQFHHFCQAHKHKKIAFYLNNYFKSKFMFQVLREAVSNYNCNGYYRITISKNISGFLKI